jgi:hypothetical protein
VVMYLCVRGIDFASIYDFSIVFLELFWQCGRLVFSFYYLATREMKS